MNHSSKINEAGEMHSTTCAGVICYDIFTKAGFYRGGKIYSEDKIFRVISGNIEFIYEKDGLDIHEIINPKSGKIIILAGIPHIFKSLTDSVFFESFSKGTKSEDFERYKAMKK